jgi:2-polyprenyl-3-methyl-5-hydroxy-6-metoxy-1,4-benzoquinol methylase
MGVRWCLVLGFTGEQRLSPPLADAAPGWIRGQRQTALGTRAAGPSIEVSIGHNGRVHERRTAQLRSGGDSTAEIHAAALHAVEPARNLSWLDVGCGKGAVLRKVRDSWNPRSLRGLDLIDWLEHDLRGDVQLVTGPAEERLAELEPADRVLMVEVLANLEAPWTALRAAGRLVAARGRIVVTTPNVQSLRSRMELLTRGQLTGFRPENEPHFTPALPHVIERLFREEGLSTRRLYRGRDVVPLAGGRPWPSGVNRRIAGLTSVSVLVVGLRADRGDAGQ